MKETNVSKITIKHYLNKKVKTRAKDKNVVNQYPVYLSIWFKGRITQIKSRWWVFYYYESEPDDEEHESIVGFLHEAALKHKNHEYVNAFNEEVKFIESVIKYFYLKYDINILLKSPVEVLDKCYRSITGIVSDEFKILLQKSFTQSADIGIISARLMINWKDLSFVNIYDGLNRLSNDGKNKTEFYRVILRQHTQHYESLKTLYEILEDKRFNLFFDVENFTALLRAKLNQKETAEIFQILESYEQRLYSSM